MSQSAFRLFTLLFLFIGGAVAAELPQTSHDGLQLVPSKEVQVLYVRPGATLAPYKRVALLDCYVAFRKNWQRDQNTSGTRVTAKDMEGIKTALAQGFRESFTSELQKGGYEMVSDADGDDVLVLRPAIVNLDITAPDVMTAGRSRTFATSAGSMTLYLEVFDGASGEILARVLDPEAAYEDVRLTWQNSVTNRSEAKRILDRWAKLARTALDRARAAPATAAR